MISIRPVRSAELNDLRRIERDAGLAFAAIGMPEIAAVEPLQVPELDGYRARGSAWVAVDADDHPVGYLISSTLDSCTHIDQVSVTGAHARRRVGATLIEHLAATSSAHGRPALTLTAFRDVPWNAPYYARLGFAVIDPGDHGPELRALIAKEGIAIPGDAPRVAMRRLL